MKEFTFFKRIIFLGIFFLVFGTIESHYFIISYCEITILMLSQLSLLRNFFRSIAPTTAITKIPLSVFFFYRCCLLYREHKRAIRYNHIDEIFID